MEKEDINIMRFLLDRVLLHSHPDGIGWKSQFIATFTEDEIKAIQRIKEGL